MAKITPSKPKGSLDHSSPVNRAALLCVTAPAANLRKEPRDGDDGAFDDLQESQLLANELFRPVHEEGNWYYGQAMEQPYLTEEGWIGYPGWVNKSELGVVSGGFQPNAVVISRDVSILPRQESTETPLLALPLATMVYAESGSDRSSVFLRVHLYSGLTGWVRRDSLRLIDDPRSVPLRESSLQEVVENAFLFIGVSYRWGGMKAPPTRTLGASPSSASGVDCSALVCLSYRLSGINIPRNARDQWLWARPLREGGLRMGDLVFIAGEGTTENARHVMICTGQETLIEASETGRTVSETTFTEKFGRSFEDLKRVGFVVTGRKIYLGRIAKGMEPAHLSRSAGR
jgi:cell wall-associated NlpC family hydrolase